MTKKGLVTLKAWDTYAVAEGNTSVDSLWASSSILSVIRVQQEIDKTRRFAALVGHFSSPDQDSLEDFLHEARARFGKEVKIILRGGAALLMDSDPKIAKAGLTNICREERASFLKVLEAHGYTKSQMDIEWAKANHGTKIIYHARTGIADVLTQVIDAEDVDIGDLPDVF